MTKTFRYPVTYNAKTDRDGNIYWVGEQKQLGVKCEDPDLDTCQTAVEREVRWELVNRFDTRYGAGMYSQTLSVRTEIVVSVRRSVSLAEFGLGVAEDAPDEFAEGKVEVEN